MLSAETDSQHGDCGTGTERPCGARAHLGNAEQKEDSADGCRTELEKNTTDRLRGAEIRAYGKLSAEELNSYLEMTRKLTAALREETEKL